MTEPVTRDLVDRTELRRRLAFEVEECAPTEVGRGRRFGLEFAVRFLDAMDAVECPRGWTRDEVLAELDTHPGAVCEYQGIFDNWHPESRTFITKDWHPEVRRYDVRVVLPEAEPMVAIEIPESAAKFYATASFTNGSSWTAAGKAVSDACRNALDESGRVEVLAEGDA